MWDHRGVFVPIDVVFAERLWRSEEMLHASCTSPAPGPAERCSTSAPSYDWLCSGMPLAFLLSRRLHGKL